jgi:hypothetical protein
LQFGKLKCGTFQIRENKNAEIVERRRVGCVIAEFLDG